MTLFFHELRQGRRPLLIWTAAIGFMMAVCVLIFPAMKNDAASLSSAFASMGAFTEAFGMDRINFGEFIGFYAVECGNVLGLGGALFAALLGIAALAKEEKEHTAEFLLAHPVSRTHIAVQKLCAVMVQLLLLNIAVLLLSLLSMLIIGESPPWRELLLLHLAYTLLQLELAALCFGVSAFIRRGGMALGLGVALMFYFLNIAANIAAPLDFLKYITPFGYTEGADIISSGSLNGLMLALGALYSLAALAAALAKYRRKDICA